MPENNSSTVHESILIVAEHRRGHGTGHIRRSLYLAKKLTEYTVGVGCPPPDFLLPENAGTSDRYSRREVLELIGLNGDSDCPVRWVDHPEGPYDRIIIDRRSMNLDELRSLPSRGIVIGIDAAGDLRRYASYVLDTLPAQSGASRANVFDSGFLPLPEAVRDQWPDEATRILIVFGGEDPARSVRANAHELAVELQRRGRTVDVVMSRAVPGDEKSVVNMIEPHPDLAEHLYRYDLVITHFGVLAYQALWSRVPVVLLNPTSYHRQLSQKAGFPTVRTVRDLLRKLRHFDSIVQSSRRIRPRERRDAAAHIMELAIPDRRGAPSGGDPYQPALERFPERSFHRNESDGIVYLQNFHRQSIHYDHDYFFADYVAQYGRTYLEDFDSIVRTGHGRIKRIVALLENREMPHLLDIGCAYGPFLKAAHEAGCLPVGLEINRDAVRHVQENLHLHAIEGDLTRIDPEAFNQTFDIITMWYVIEHVVDLDGLLDNLSALLRKGGILAFSTPHGKGVSARRSRRDFLKNSPQDHYTVWDMTSARRILRKHGFAVRLFHVTGHHPERFSPLFPRWTYRFLGIVSRLFKLGDTFEVYAERL